MSHIHYDTEAFVLHGTSLGEANRYLTLLTKEFGLLRAVGRGLRLERSKLRYCLQEGARVRVSLVRGREVWRLTGAVLLEMKEIEPERRQLLARLSFLLRRLLPGEERNESLFEIFAAAHRYILDDEKATVAALEELVVLRMLASLGYRSSSPLLSPLLDGVVIDTDALVFVRSTRQHAVAEINALLTMTEL